MPDISQPIVTVDAVILTLHAGELHVVVHDRTRAPFEAVPALPGGYVHAQEDIDCDAAIRRVLRDKLGLNGFYLEQLYTFSGQDRDPRGWSISVTFLALVPHARLTGGEERGLRLVPVSDVPHLAFDHARILQVALARLRGKGAYSSLPASLIEAPFTLTELQRTYEAVLNEKIDPASFRTKILAGGIIRDTGEKRGGPSRRPAALYDLLEAPRTLTRTLGNAA